MDSKLVKGLEAIYQGDIMLICFPYAGGGASAYYRWSNQLADVCHVCPIQLPGREERLVEQAYTRVEDVAEQVVDILQNYDNPMVLYGHSMGTKILYEVEKRLEERNKAAQLVIVSGCRPPHEKETKLLADLSDEDFVEALAEFHGIPEALLENKELLHFFLPTLRADFLLSESYQCFEKKLLQAPIRAMGGNCDSEAPEDDMRAWKEYHPEDFECQMFEGTHFYIREHEHEVVHQIEAWIKQYVDTERI